jgi:hypothetical protein
VKSRQNSTSREPAADSGEQRPGSRQQTKEGKQQAAESSKKQQAADSTKKLVVAPPPPDDLVTFSIFPHFPWPPFCIVLFSMPSIPPFS